MTILGNLIRLFSVYIVYPVIVIGLFFFLGYSIYNLVKHAREMEKLRRITGALLPIAGLVFLLVLTEQRNLSMNGLYNSLHSFWGLIAGLFIGASVITIGNYLKEFDEEILPTLFTLFLSFIAVFVLYSIMQFKLGELNYFLMGIIIGGGAIVIWKGIPNVLLAERYNPWTVKGNELHKDIAKEYLSQEAGLSDNEIEYIIANTGFFTNLTPGNYIFNHYVDGVYLSAVTRGHASVSPGESLSADEQKRLSDSDAVSNDESAALVTRRRASITPRDALSVLDRKQLDNLEEAPDKESYEFKRTEW